MDLLEKYLLLTIVAIIVCGLAAVGGSYIGETTIPTCIAGMAVFGVGAYVGLISDEVFYVVALILFMVMMTRIGEK